MRRRTLLATLFASHAFAGKWRNRVPTSFEAGLIELMQVAPVPGAAIGVLQAGRLDFTRGIGVLALQPDAASSARITETTIFQAASLTKQVTAYIAFALRNQGKLDFDKPLVSYVDDLPSPEARRVTIRHVLSHSSGFPNWRSEADLVPAFAPGARFQYSGEGYFYLQRVLEHVSGTGFGRLAATTVFAPLGMTSTSMMWRPEFEARCAVPHDRRGQPRSNWDSRPRRLHDIARKQGRDVDDWKYEDYAAAAREAGGRAVPDNLLPNGAASMVTCAADYARFVSAAIRNPEIGKEQIRIRPALGWGLGWGIERAGNRQYLWQWGDNGGFKNIVAVDPASGDGVFVFTNGDSGKQVYDRILTHATGHDHPALFWI